MTYYLTENGHRIQIIGKISINDSVQFLGVTAQAWGNGLPFLCNLQETYEATGWGSGNYSIQDWGGSMLDTNIITNIAWGASVNPLPAYLSRSPVNPRAAQHRVHNNLLCCRRRECSRIPSNWRNPIVNPQVHPRYENMEGLVTQ